MVILPAQIVAKSADLQKLSAAGVAVQEMTGFRVLQLKHGVVFSSEGQTQTVSITVAAKQALPAGTGDQPPAEILEVARALLDSYPPAGEASFVVVRFSATCDRYWEEWAILAANGRVRSQRHANGGSQ